MKESKKRGLFLLILLFVLAAMAGSIIDYAIRNERVVKSSVYRTMSEAAHQQLTLFNTMLNDQFSHLELLADYVSRHGTLLDDELIHVMDLTADVNSFYGLGIIDAASGMASLYTGETFSASGRAYFETSLSGERAIEYNGHGRLTGIPVIVMSVPVYSEGSVTAVIFGTHKTSGFAELMETTSFGGQSYSYITDSEGRVIVETMHESALPKENGENILELFSEAELERGVTADQIGGFMKSGEPFTFSLTSGGERRYISFIPMHTNGWSLFYVTTDKVVDDETAVSSRLVFHLALKLLLIFFVLILGVLHYEHQRQRSLILREEEFRIAAGQSNRMIMRYDIQKKTSTYTPGCELSGAQRRVLSEGVPESVVAEGLVAEESVGDYLEFYAAMRRGEPTGTKVFRMKTEQGDLAWFRANYTIVGKEKKPRFAIITFCDVTRQREQEIAYERWQRSLRERPPESYSLYHCNISNGLMLDANEGMLLLENSGASCLTLDARTAKYAEKCVYSADREHFLSVLDSKAMLMHFRQGRQTDTLEYREMLSDGGLRWLRLTVDLLDAPNSFDVEAYLLFEDIDEAKRMELDIKERAETDPLTGLLNRATFRQKADELMADSKSDALYALLMLDMDAFKLVNDVFGHSAGDHVLIETAELLRKCSRRGDLVGRLGGDEFVVLLSDIPGRNIAAKKAQQICDLSRKALSPEVQISVSVGIALSPEDGSDFDSLYKKADKTLYHVKDTGKNNYAFYHEGIDEELTAADHAPLEDLSAPQPVKKRRMLIVEDSPNDIGLLSDIFQKSFRIETALSCSAALTKLHHYGSAISIVLLDLMMSDVDVYSVLKFMRDDPEMRTIPVIVVNDREDHATNLKAIRAGADDFIAKPVDPDILRIRVESSVSKAENERLRAQNSFLELKSNEMNSYRTALERAGTMLIVHDWLKGTFTYSPSVSSGLSGKYDSRALWRVLLSDMVADSQTVQKMQQLVHDIANDRTRADGCMTARLKSISGDMLLYEMNVYKQTNDFGLTSKLIITLKPVDFTRNPGLADKQLKKKSV